jgi:hypothetical protein
MKENETLLIVSNLADKITEDYSQWGGDVFDLVATSSLELNTKFIQGLAEEFDNKQIVTSSSSIYFYTSGCEQRVFIRSIRDNKGDKA